MTQGTEFDEWHREWILMTVQGTGVLMKIPLLGVIMKVRKLVLMSPGDRGRFHEAHFKLSLHSTIIGTYVVEI